MFAIIMDNKEQDVRIVKIQDKFLTRYNHLLLHQIGVSQSIALDRQAFHLHHLQCLPHHQYHAMVILIRLKLETSVYQKHFQRSKCVLQLSLPPHIKSLLIQCNVTGMTVPIHTSSQIKSYFSTTEYSSTNHTSFWNQDSHHGYRNSNNQSSKIRYDYPTLSGILCSRLSTEYHQSSCY